MGRPPKPPGTALTVTKTVKFTEHEGRCIARGAEAAGVSEAEWIRQALQFSAFPALSKALEIEAALRLADERKAERKRVLDERRKKKGK